MFKRKCLKCGTVVSKKDVYCPECGVNIQEYFNKNKKRLLMGKHPEDSVMAQKKPEIGTGMIIFLVILTILFIPLGLIVSGIVWYSHKKNVEEWQRNQIILNTS